MNGSPRRPALSHSFDLPEAMSYDALAMRLPSADWFARMRDALAFADRILDGTEPLEAKRIKEEIEYLHFQVMRCGSLAYQENGQMDLAMRKKEEMETAKLAAEGEALFYKARCGYLEAMAQRECPMILEGLPAKPDSWYSDKYRPEPCSPYWTHVNLEACKSLNETQAFLTGLAEKAPYGSPEQKKLWEHVTSLSLEASLMLDRNGAFRLQERPKKS